MHQAHYSLIIGPFFRTTFFSRFPLFFQEKQEKQEMCPNFEILQRAKYLEVL